MADLFGRCKECKYHCKECDDIYKEKQAEKITHTKMKGTSLCWCCVHAVPKKGKYGYKTWCSWSIYRQPVKGWIAEKGEFKHENVGNVVTYSVSECPKFKRG